MPIVLSTLFCAPSDVWDMLSTVGVDLRQDDYNLASGQIITTTAAAVEGATSLTVSPIPVALLAGAQLTFDGNMADPITALLTAAAAVGATSLTVAALGGAIAISASARDSGINAATGARLLVGTRKGTSKVKLYCNGRYDDSQLVLSGTVCDWAVTCACKFLCTRRAQGCPKSIAEDFKEVMEELRQVQAGQLAIEDCGTRGVDWPSMSNIIVNAGYDGMRARVQRNFSEGTPTAYPQFVDWNSAVLLSY